MSVSSKKSTQSRTQWLTTTVILLMQSSLAQQGRLISAQAPSARMAPGGMEDPLITLMAGRCRQLPSAGTSARWSSWPAWLPLDEVVLGLGNEHPQAALRTSLRKSHKVTSVVTWPSNSEEGTWLPHPQWEECQSPHWYTEPVGGDCYGSLCK